MSRKRNENAPWSEQIKRHPTGLPGVVAAKLEKNGAVSYEEVQEGACAGHRSAKFIFERLVMTGRAEWNGEEGIVKA